MYTKQVREFSEKMNQMARQRRPFFFAVDFEGVQPFICLLEDMEKEDIYFRFHEIPQSIPHGFSMQKHPVPFAEYKRSFDMVSGHIHYGNSYLCNLTFPTIVELDNTLNDLYACVHSKYKILFKKKWLTFSPETFVKMNDGKIYTYPMKGTISADIEQAEKKLLMDEKEQAEHYTVVDLLRNDLSMVSRNVRVTRFRYIEKIKTAEKDLLQASSEIVGELDADYLNNLGTLFCSLLPAGSISGAPKKKTIEIIQEAETYSRGFYTGVAGVFDGKNLDSCVLIRFLEKTEKGWVYKSGGGITKSSEVKKEYQELIDKVYVPVS